MAVSVRSRTERNAEVEVSLEKTGAQRGRIRVRSWKRPAAAAAAETPHRDETYELYDIVTNEGGSLTTCRAVAPGSDPQVTISIEQGITIDVRGTSFRLGDGRTTYDLTPDAQTSVKNFLVDSFGG